MKLVLFLILLLVGLDFAFNGGGATRLLRWHLHDAAAGIAAYVFAGG